MFTVIYLLYSFFFLFKSCYSKLPLLTESLLPCTHSCARNNFPTQVFLEIFWVELFFEAPLKILPGKVCLTCLRTLCASFTYVIYVPSCLPFLTCLTCLHFFTSLKFLPSFTCLKSFYFIRALSAFIYMLIKLIYVNELTCNCSFFATIGFCHISTFIKYFQFYKTRVIFCMTFSFLKTKNIT